jgi:hypothetical protein
MLFPERGTLRLQNPGSAMTAAFLPLTIAKTSAASLIFVSIPREQQCDRFSGCHFRHQKERLSLGNFPTK